MSLAPLIRPMHGLMISVALLQLTSLMYYSDSYFLWLPVMQKLSLLSCIGWLCAVHYALPLDPAGISRAS